GSRCDAGTVTLGATASAGIVNWYSVSTGGTSMGTGTNFITPSISATTLYYVDATSGGCTTASRTSVSARVNTSPSITGATPGSRCDAGTVTLGATASAGIVNWYSVSTGGTSMGTGTNFITPSISATTLYYVDATSGGCTTASRTAITATVNTTPSITSTTPGSRCDAGTVTLGATASVGTVNWYNVATGGTSIGTGTSFTTPYILATTSYYTDATQNGCTTTSRTTVVAEVINSPAVNLGSDTILCSNGYLLDAGNNGAHYLWNTGDTTSAIITAYSGQYSVTVTGSTGCTASDTIMLVINPEFIVNLGPDTFLCNNSPVTITINNAGLIYLWNTGSTQQSITVNTAGYYSVTVTDNNGCNAADSIQVIYSKGIIKGKITYNNLPVANNNLSIHVYSTTLNTRGGYDEVTAPITVFGQGEYKITGLTSDNYIVKVFLNNHTNEYLNVLNSYYSSDTLASDWATASEIIINCDTVTADINIGSRISNGLAFGHIRGGVYYTVSGTKEFTETDTLGNPVSGADIFIERKTDHLAIFNTCTDAGGKFEVKNIYWGEYTVRVDIAGFDQLATYSINIHNADTIYRNLNFIVDTTAGSGFIDTVRILSSPFIESDVSSIIIYPNPFSEELYLECNILKQSSASCRVEIYNISGSLVFSETEKQNAGTIKLKVELNHFSPGVYFIKLRAGNTIFIRKIVKTE
ncbi:MAG: T9SS type A sorting domain-containing protein, partial [Bacteroidia bacterium]|nr:T9SS type A sorting domain-containing protein [Bacteroidia bacterium]